MVDRIRRFQVLNSQIFAILNKYMKNSEGGKSIDHKYPKIFLTIDLL